MDNPAAPPLNYRDWIGDVQGGSQFYPGYRVWDLLQESYYFHRFLTEVEDILLQHDFSDSSLNPENYLHPIHKLVRKLIINSYWIQNQYLEPCQKTGVSVLNLYDEIGFPLTVQSVTFSPGFKSPIHSHGTWGVVAILKGQEKNTFWRRIIDPNLDNKFIPTGNITLIPGDIISFTPDVIHQIEARASTPSLPSNEEPLVIFNIYGETQASQRFELNPITQQIKKY